MRISRAWVKPWRLQKIDTPRARCYSGACILQQFAELKVCRGGNHFPRCQITRRNK